MSQEYENSDDYRKVFVSRLPMKWKDDMLKQHFESCFGGVEAASINWDKENDCSLGYGFVTFLNEDGCKAALEQGSMHVQRKIIQIRAVQRDGEEEGGGRGAGVCFMWQKRRCVKGDACKFLHEGEGACVAVADPYQGLARRKCLSFKAKGKCSKGDKCHFLHIAKDPSNGPPPPNIMTSTSTNNSNNCGTTSVEVGAGSQQKPWGVCHAFKKKGKCRKGDRCKFSHAVAEAPVVSSTTASEATGKRKRIDGALLVKNRKVLLAEGCSSRGSGEGGNSWTNEDIQDSA